MYSNGEMFQLALINIILPIGAVCLFIMFINMLNAYGSRTIRLRGAKKHSWHLVKENNRSFRCNICKMLLLNLEVYYCDSCGVCADTPCLKAANNKYKCKETYVESEGPMKHIYMKGNMPLGSECEVCEEECADDLRCIWCLRTVHNSCQQMLGDICDFGKYKKFLLPPNYVILTKKRSRVGAPVKLFHINEPPWSQSWNPLFVLANCKSGNMKGRTVLSEFRKILNNLQVIDLSEKNPAILGDWLSVLPESAKPIILVAGGDGTIAWVLSTIKKFVLKRIPPVCVIPLGTGNDLSRVLGWGKQEPEPFSPHSILQNISDAVDVKLDSWTVNIQNKSRLSRHKSEYLMYNYLSIGVDALVTLDFHNTRQSRFYIFSSRIINKLLYLIFGTQQVMERQCKGLEQSLELYLDGQLVDLPELESIVILNIPSWGAGVYLWNLGLEDEEIDQVGKQSMSDGKLEIVAISSSFHIAQLQVGLSQPQRLGQASKVKIRVKNRAPMQIDGEPWMQHPCEINIKWDGQAVMLKNSVVDEQDMAECNAFSQENLEKIHPVATL